MNKTKDFVLMVATEISKRNDCILNYIELCDHEKGKGEFVKATHQNGRYELVFTIWEMNNGKIYEWGNCIGFKEERELLRLFREECEERNDF